MDPELAWLLAAIGVSAELRERAKAVRPELFPDGFPRRYAALVFSENWDGKAWGSLAGEPYAVWWLECVERFRAVLDAESARHTIDRWLEKSKALDMADAKRALDAARRDHEKVYRKLQRAGVKREAAYRRVRELRYGPTEGEP